MGSIYPTGTALAVAVLVGGMATAWGQSREIASLSSARVAGAPGLRIRATDIEENEEFRRMLLAALRDSPTTRAILVDIDSESDPGNAIEIVLGRDLPGVLIDSFERNLIDLEDLERLPSAHDAELDRNAITREEQIVHILAERHHAAKMIARLRELHVMSPSRKLIFNASHDIGLLRENEYRAERGQTPVIDAISHLVKDSPGAALIEYRLADGTTSYIVTSHHGQIDRIVPPLPAVP